MIMNSCRAILFVLIFLNNRHGTPKQNMYTFAELWNWIKSTQALFLSGFFVDKSAEAWHQPVSWLNCSVYKFSNERKSFAFLDFLQNLIVLFADYEYWMAAKMIWSANILIVIARWNSCKYVADLYPLSIVQWNSINAVDVNRSATVASFRDFKYC